MVVPADVENQQQSDNEETPLLREEDNNLERQTEPTQSPTLLYLSSALKVLLCILAVGIVTPVVKGWIEAGSDINVCTATTKTHLKLPKVFSV